MMNYQQFGDALESALGYSIRAPFLARLGNPTLDVTADRIRVPMSDTDRPGMVYIHSPIEGQWVDKAVNTVLDLNTCLFGDYVLVREISQNNFAVERFAYREQAEYRADVVVYSAEPVGIERFNYGLLQPTNPPSMRALVSRAVYDDDNLVLNTETDDFTADIPATANTAVLIRVDLNPATGAFDYVVGTEFIHSDYTDDQALAAGLNPPTANQSYNRAGWVRLYNGMTAILRNNIITAPDILSKGGNGERSHLTSVRVASTSNVDIASAPSSIDSVTLAAGDRILLASQTSSPEKGVWIFNGASSALTRPADLPSGGTMPAALLVYVSSGTSYSTGLFQSGSSVVVIDTDNQSWVITGLRLNTLTITNTGGTVWGKFVSTGLNSTYSYNLPNVGGLLAGMPFVGFRSPVIAVETTNISTSSAPATIDGVTLASGDRVLLTGQSTKSQNGLWVFNGAASALTRPIDYPTTAGALSVWVNVVIYVVSGDVYAGTLWKLDTTASVTPGTTSTDWSMIPLAGGLSVVSGGVRGDFAHANAADRTYTLPDKTGTVALLDDIPATIGVTASSEVTIAAGVVTLGTGSHYTVDTESDAGSDDLDTISGGTANRLYIFRAENDARTVIFKHGTGNIYTFSGSDITLDTDKKVIMGLQVGTNMLIISPT